MAVLKPEFIRQLVELCAGVNRELAGKDSPIEPGRYADQLDGFVSRASDLPAPEQDREDLDRLLDAMGTAADKFREAEITVAAENQEQAAAAVDEVLSVGRPTGS